MLSRVMKQLKYRCATAAVGNAGGVEVPLSIIPFLLRGVSLLGIDSVLQPFASRAGRLGAAGARPRPRQARRDGRSRRSSPTCPALGAAILEGPGAGQGGGGRQRMIAPAYVRTMAAYNAEMNRRVYDAAARLDDAERRADRGAFWRSIHGTLCHLLWADTVWMARLGLGQAPGVPIAESDRFVADFAELRRRRESLDAEIVGWAERLEPADLEGDLAWFSGAIRREMVKPRALCVCRSSTTRPTTAARSTRCSPAPARPPAPPTSPSSFSWG